MGMTASGTGMEDEDKSISEINVTPLVDVMLVLLIIFLITIPVITQSVPVELPKAANIPTATKPENINIEVHPNYEHVITLTPTKAGTYSIICNEYCGINHHTMASRLYVK